MEQGVVISQYDIARKRLHNKCGRMFGLLPTSRMLGTLYLFKEQPIDKQRMRLSFAQNGTKDGCFKF